MAPWDYVFVMFWRRAVLMLLHASVSPGAELWGFFRCLVFGGPLLSLVNKSINIM
jgi:hypothetical protein